MNLQENPQFLRNTYGSMKTFELTGIHINTLNLRGIHLKEYYRIHGNTQDYSTIHMNLQKKQWISKKYGLLAHL